MNSAVSRWMSSSTLLTCRCLLSCWCRLPRLRLAMVGLSHNSNRKLQPPTTPVGAPYNPPTETANEGLQRIDKTSGRGTNCHGFSEIAFECQTNYEFPCAK